MKTFTRFSLAATALITASSAQQNYAINPDSVANTTRDYWCQQQVSQCPLICLQEGNTNTATQTNDCDSASLTYSCVCSNGLSPNVSEYSQTLPYFICTAWGNQCVSNCGNGNNECAEKCRTQHPCGAQNPTRQNTSTLTMSRTTGLAAGNGAGVSTDANGQTIYSGLAGAGGSSSAANSGHATFVRGWALSVGQTFGMVGLVGAFVGGFAVLL